MQSRVNYYSTVSNCTNKSTPNNNVAKVYTALLPCRGHNSSFSLTEPRLINYQKTH